MSWPTVALGDVCITGSGGTPSRSNGAYYGGGIPWVKSGELLSDVITSTEETISEEGLKKSSAKLLEPGCILLAMYGASIGKTATLGIRAATNQAVCNIRPKDDRISADFIRIFLEYSKPSLIRRGAGGAQPNISQNIIRDTEIPLPPLEEQRRIAGILDAADALRRRRREALALLDTLPGAIFAELFGDVSETYTLKEAGTDFRYGTSSKSQDHGLPVLRIPNVVGGDIDLSEIKTVPLSAKEEARFALKDGDILLVRTNGNRAYVGRSAVFNRKKVAAHEMADRTWSFASYLIRARLKEKELLPDFIQGFLSSAAGRKQLLASSKTSAGQFNINTEALGAIRVPKVAVPAQAAFVDRVAEIKNHRQQVLDHLSELEALFVSLQSRAFAGEL